MNDLSYRDFDRELIRGAIDMHVHAAPCPFPRPFDDAEIAVQARDMGFKAIVVKDHHQPTTGRVHHAQKLANGIKLFGSLVLNTYEGGLNPYAVEAAVRFYEARVIWLPTVTSAAHLKVFGQPSLTSYKVQFRPVNGISILREGKLAAEVSEIIQICKEGDVCLGTGHISALEIAAVIEECKKQGFKKLMITHPLFNVPSLSIDEQKEFSSEEGVFLEYTYLPMTPIWNQDGKAKKTAEAIKAVGFEKCVMSSDLGNYLNQPAPEGLRCFIECMLHYEIKPEEIEFMVKRNPAYLLGI
jgi:hypothetical protein